MHKSWLALSFIAAMFLACGSDSSSGADSSEDITEVSKDNSKSSSSVSKDSASSDSKKSSSSSNKTNSSSSVKPESGASEGSSSSAEPESSSEEQSSSSVKPESSVSKESSSSVKLESSASKESSSSVKPESSASKESSSSVKPESSASKESSSSAEPESSASEESSSSAELVFRDASIYDADANTLTDLRNGKVYKTTTIKIVDEERGIDYSEVWMAENLNYVTDCSYCYGDEPEKCTTYGRLYTWVAAVGKSESECGNGQVCNLPAGEDIRGICPEGWHLPSEGEWNALTDAVSNSAEKLRSISGWNRAGTDIYSFSAIATGFRNVDGSFANEDDGTAFWSSTTDADDSDLAYMMIVGDVYTYTIVTKLSKLRGHSIRCLKD